MDPVPHHSYVIPQQRPIGDSSNKRKDAYFGDASDSYDRKVSESEGKNQESAARRDTDNHSGNIILIGESMLGHAAGRMSNHNFPSAQDGKPEPCGLSHERQCKTSLPYPGVKDIHRGSSKHFYSYNHGAISGQNDCVPVSTCSLVEPGSYPPYYFTPTKPSEKMSHPWLQPSSVTPWLVKDLDHLRYENVTPAVNINKNAQGFGIELENMDHPGMKGKASSDSCNKNKRGLGATNTNTFLDAHTEVSQSSLSASESSGNFQPHFERTYPQAAVDGCTGPKSTNGIVKAQHVSGLVGNAASTINCGLLAEKDSNNSNNLSVGSQFKSLSQQTGQNDSETENMKHVLPRKCQGPSSHGIEDWKDKKELPCSLMDGIDNLHDKDAVPSSQEALWDGFLQLNTSVTVATVAYFKSGEQNLKINWPERIEVKGRVRLEAFEKFIQDLPRSRHRALMVVSFCGSVRSSKASSVGMEEVAKNYEESKRIGFAEIGPGIDLYICPRSETIITILAKYGFYKGMATTRGNHVLIGCIVWRRNHVISNSRQKSLEKRKQSSPEKELDFTSSSQGEDANTPLPSLTVQKSDLKLLIPSAPPANHVNAPLQKGSKGQLANPVGGYIVPLAAIREESVSTCGNGLPEASISLPSSTSKSADLSSTGPGSSSLVDICRQFVENKDVDFKSFMQKPAGEYKEVMHTDLRLPKKHSNLQITNLSYDDDLPEFDFSKTCNLERYTSNMPPIVDNECQNARVHSSDSIEVRKIDGCATTALLDINSRPSFSPQGCAIPRLPKPVFTDTHGTSMLTVIGKSDCEPSRLPVPHAKNPGEQLIGTRSVGMTVTTSVPTPLSASYLRKLWDDDDDAMPEWRPPYLEVQEPVELRLPPASGSLLPLPEPQSTVVNIIRQPTIHRIPSGLSKPFWSSPPTSPRLHLRVHGHGHLLAGVTPASGTPSVPQKRNAGMHEVPSNISSNYTSNSASSKAFRPSSNSRFESTPPVNRRRWK
ncbi:unnamed protein product [Victoria cruziana]